MIKEQSEQRRDWATTSVELKKAQDLFTEIDNAAGTNPGGRYPWVRRGPSPVDQPWAQPVRASISSGAGAARGTSQGYRGTSSHTDPVWKSEPTPRFQVQVSAPAVRK